MDPRWLLDKNIKLNIGIKRFDFYLLSLIRNLRLSKNKYFASTGLSNRRRLTNQSWPAWRALQTSWSRCSVRPSCTRGSSSASSCSGWSSSSSCCCRRTNLLTGHDRSALWWRSGCLTWGETSSFRSSFRRKFRTNVWGRLTRSEARKFLRNFELKILSFWKFEIYSFISLYL